MSFKDAITSGIKDIKQAQLSSTQQAFDQFPTINARSVVGSTDAQELAVYDNGGVGWVSTAINRKMVDISNIDFYVKDKKGNRIELNKLPNDLDMPFVNGWAGLTFNKMAAIAIAREDLCGNDIWVKSTNANKYSQMTKKVGEFMLVPSGSWNIVMRPDYRSIWYYIVSFGATVMYLEPQDVIHFRANNLLNPFIGIGLISQARATVESEVVATEYENNFLVRDGSPNMVFIDKTMNNPEGAIAKAAMMRKQYATGAYKNNLFYAYGDVSIEAFKTVPKDVQFVKPMNRELIISIMQSSPIVLGLETSSGDRATANRATNNYFGIVNSRARAFCDTINQQFFRIVDNTGHELTYTPYAVGDTEEIGQQITNGLITRNEARKSIGRDVDENDPTLNTIYVPNNYITIGQAYEGSYSNPYAEPVKKKQLY